jgi:hypothetical protein
LWEPHRKRARDQYHRDPKGDPRYAADPGPYREEKDSRRQCDHGSGYGGDYEETELETHTPVPGISAPESITGSLPAPERCASAQRQSDEAGQGSAERENTFQLGSHVLSPRRPTSP